MQSVSAKKAAPTAGARAPCPRAFTAKRFVPARRLATRAAVEGSNVTATTGNVEVHATATPVVVSVGVGIVQAAQYGVVGGSIAFNTIRNTGEAYASGTGTLRAPAGTVRVKAEEGGTLVAVGGGAAIANGLGAIGASFSLNTLDNTIRAYADHGVDRLVLLCLPFDEASTVRNLDDLAALRDAAQP